MRLNVIDSHTGGEPTRVLLEGSIELAGETMAERRDDFARRFDRLRSGVVNEPRGSEVLVGALLTPPVTPNALAGIVFFNNAGYLGMCGHGTIGVVETLRHLGRITEGEVKFDTPVGSVRAQVSADGEVTLQNVVGYRYKKDIRIDVEGIGPVVGDVGYGGNWFFIVHEPHFSMDLANWRHLTQLCLNVRDALERECITGADGAEIDHVELFGDPTAPGALSKNFVLCPGGAYDRSPCGTGTSAKLACLYAAGKLKAGEWYTQESITGSVFRGMVQPVDEGVIPTIVGRAHVTAESTLIFSDDDPLRWGLQI